MIETVTLDGIEYKRSEFIDRFCIEPEIFETGIEDFAEHCVLSGVFESQHDAVMMVSTVMAKPLTLEQVEKALSKISDEHNCDALYDKESEGIVIDAKTRP